MYKLELRVLFDAAAAAAVADAVQREEQQAEEALQEDESQSENPQEETAGLEGEAEPGSENEFEQELDEALAGITETSPENDINVLLISDSLANADEIADAAEPGTIVIRYDASKALASDLIDIINEALDDKVESIGFITDADENSHLHLFADEDTSGTTASDQLQSEFWDAVEDHLTSNGQVKIFAAHLLSTAEGQELVDTLKGSAWTRAGCFRRYV